VHKSHSYESGLITFCSPCQTLFLVKDTNSYRCVCCGSKTRSSPKTKSRVKVEKFRHE
jgi:DNA-directed RNA polymerase subunit M/transcription elongation factor TFIIS